MQSKLFRHKHKEDKVMWELNVQRTKQEIAQDLIEKFPWTAKKLTLTKVKLMNIKDMYKLKARLELNHLQS